VTVRCRQHVNPLAIKFQKPVDLPDWSGRFADLSRPLLLDIGCARGRFLMDMAVARPDWNCLGLEIREPLVEEATGRATELGLSDRLQYLFCNANISLSSILAGLPTEHMELVTIQFPDPWFKKRHQKRRVVQPELVAALADALQPGAQVFLQSDILELAEDMCDRFSSNPTFRRLTAEWMPENPLGVPTERELSVQRRNLPVFRALYERTRSGG
jgi:tRNA (guanine-N7-)-methyltransferase